MKTQLKTYFDRMRTLYATAVFKSIHLDLHVNITILFERISVLEINIDFNNEQTTQ